jgi:hypothetical protein
MKIIRLETEVRLDISNALHERTASNQSGYMNLITVCRRHGLNTNQITHIIDRLEDEVTDMIVEAVEDNG